MLGKRGDRKEPEGQTVEELSFLDYIEQQTEFVHDALLNYLIAFNKCKCLLCYTEFKSGHCGLFYHCIYIASSGMSAQVLVLTLLCRSFLGRHLVNVC